MMTVHVSLDQAMDVLSQLANIVLPGAAFAERAGSYVNRADVLQSFDWAIRPPAGVLSAGQLFWRMLGRQGMYDAPALLAEVAREIPYFAAALPPVPDDGIDLKMNQLAEA